MYVGAHDALFVLMLVNGIAEYESALDWPLSADAELVPFCLFAFASRCASKLKSANAANDGMMRQMTVLAALTYSLVFCAISAVEVATVVDESPTWPKPGIVAPAIVVSNSAVVFHCST